METTFNLNWNLLCRYYSETCRTCWQWNWQCVADEQLFGHDFITTFINSSEVMKWQSKVQSPYSFKTAVISIFLLTNDYESLKKTSHPQHWQLYSFLCLSSHCFGFIVTISHGINWHYLLAKDSPSCQTVFVLFVFALMTINIIRPITLKIIISESKLAS